MFETEALALAFAEQDETIEYCETCECWTVIDWSGYPICYCA